MANHTGAHSDVEGLESLRAIVRAAQEAAELGEKLQALADTIAEQIDALAPATGGTVEGVFAGLYPKAEEN